MKKLSKIYRPLIAIYIIAIHVILGVVLWKSDFTSIVAKNIAVSSLYTGYSDLEPQTIAMRLQDYPDEAGSLVAADVDGDGARDLIVTARRHISVYSLAGDVLWTRRIDIQFETTRLPSIHAPGIQVADIDGDGRNEVLLLSRDNMLHVLAGASGETRWAVALPAPPEEARWQHLVVANLRGAGDRDLLLQSTDTIRPLSRGRYLQAHAIERLLARSGDSLLWAHDDYIGTAHSGVRVADLDGDGRDEVLGAMLLGPDGAVLHRIAESQSGDDHIDAVHVADVRPDIPGLEVVALRETHGRPGHGNQVYLFNRDGLIWETHYDNREPQNVAIGDFDPDRPGLEIWCRSRYDLSQKPFVFDARGTLIATYEMDDVAPLGWTGKGVEVIHTIDWTGGARQLAAAKERHRRGDVAIFDPISGAFLHRLNAMADRIYVADVAGDWREELIVVDGDQLRIYRNGAANPNPDRPRLWSRPHYARSKMTWNYYNP